jgi:hypothetical protein
MSKTQFQKDSEDPAYCAWANCHCAFMEEVLKQRTKIEDVKQLMKQMKPDCDYQDYNHDLDLCLDTVYTQCKKCVLGKKIRAFLIPRKEDKDPKPCLTCEYTACEQNTKTPHCDALTSWTERQKLDVIENCENKEHR